MGIDSQLMEKLAAAQHEIWAHWMKYQFSKMRMLTTGAMELDADLVVRWVRQMDAPYSELSEGEKQSDRDIVTQFLNDIIAQAIKEAGDIAYSDAMHSMNEPFLE